MKPQKQSIQQIVALLLKPISKNWCFFLMMYLLGAFCIFVTDECIYLPFYVKLFFELFLDLYLLCILISVLPRPIAITSKCLLSILFYLCTFAELFCILRLDTQITPSVVQLVLETNAKEAGDFFSTYINPQLLLSPIGILCILLLLHLSLSVFLSHHQRKTITKQPTALTRRLSVPFVLLLVLAFLASITNKKYLTELFSKKSVDDLELYMANHNWASRSLYTSTHRFIFALHSNHLAVRQLDNLVRLYDEITIEDCNTTTQNIVLIIGESYNKHHSQLYGYPYETTPHQNARYANGELWVFQDAVTPFNLTSDVFKNMFSTNNLSNHERWTDYPLFTQVFHKAGYNVTFITNQFVKNEDKEFFDFSGSVFLNNDRIETTQFSHRNLKKYDDDLMLLAEYDSLKQYSTDKNLIIFHLLGQHFDYCNRFPKDSIWFKPSDYNRNDLNESERQIIADYDNASRYNDFVVNEIIRKFETQDAIILYLSDHGEECFDGIKQSGRIHSHELTKTIVKNEYQIPFWIWCSRAYRSRHDAIVREIGQAVVKPFFSDHLPHTLIHLGGIQTPYYNQQLDILTEPYDCHLRRLLWGTVNYQQFVP